MENRKLDEIDITILRTLQKDIRTSFKEIANQCNISTDTIKNRYNKLIENEVIRALERTRELLAENANFTVDSKVTIDDTKDKLMIDMYRNMMMANSMKWKDSSCVG